MRLPSDDRRGLLWFGACFSTFVVLVVEGGFALSLHRRLIGGFALRGEDVGVGLFIVPFNLFPLVFWHSLLGHRLPAGLISALNAHARPLASGFAVAIPFWIVAIATITGFPGLSVFQATLGWVIVLAAFVAGYRLRPRFDRRFARIRAEHRARIVVESRNAPLPLPSRRRDGRTEPGPSVSALKAEIDRSPVRATPSTIRNIDLRRTGEFTFAIEPRGLARILGGTLCLAMSIGMAIVIVLIRSQHPPGDRLTTQYWSTFAGLVGIIGLLMAIQVVFLWAGMEFDIRLDRLTHGRRWARRTLALSGIVAVQLVDQTHDDNHGKVVRLAQINLVVDDPARHRINASYHEDRRWSSRTARSLAAALGVPLIRAKVFTDPTSRSPRFRETTPRGRP